MGGAPTGNWEALPHPAEPADVRAAEAKLIVRRPGVPEVEIAIDKTEFVIGRQASDVDLVLEDEWVSRKHARLSMDERGYFRIEDLGTKSGMKFLGRTVRRLNLMDGDEFSIGKTTFVFRAKIQRLAKPEPEPMAREASVFGEPPEPEPPKSTEDGE